MIYEEIIAFNVSDKIRSVLLVSDQIEVYSLYMYRVVSIVLITPSKKMLYFQEPMLLINIYFNLN